MWGLRRAGSHGLHGAGATRPHVGGTARGRHSPWQSPGPTSARGPSNSPGKVKWGQGGEVPAARKDPGPPSQLQEGAKPSTCFESSLTSWG